MKKVLSVVLVLAMILGSFSMVFASNYSDVKDSAANSEAINVLSGLGVIGGYADGTFRPEGVVTRAEMATMIVNALGIPVKGGAATQFSDVPASHWASGYINYAASVGFIAGYTDGTFQPEKQVSYNEAITMIVAALGYTADSLVGTYPGSFINKATSLGIMDNCKTTGTTGAVRGDIAQLLYDAAKQSIGYVDKDGQFNQNVGKDGKHGSDTMLARLGADKYNDGDAFVVTGDESAAIDLAAYVGKYVTAYKNTDDEIISIDVVSETVKGKLRTDGTIGDYDVKATVKYAGKNAEENTYADNRVVSFVNAAKAGEAAAYTDLATGTYTFEVKTSGKYITEIYSASKWTVTDHDQITESHLDALEEDDELLGYEFEMTDNKEIDTTSFVLEGAASLADIKEDDVVYVYTKANSTGAAITKVTVGTEVITGTVTKLNADKDVATIGSTKYDAASEIVTPLNNSVGKEIKAWLNYDGEIYDWEEVTSDETYAILLGYDTESGAAFSSDVNKVKFFLADGTSKIYTLDSSATTAGAVGDVVTYKVNAKDKVSEVAVAESGYVTGAAISKNGVVGDKQVVDATIVFTFDGNTANAADLADEDCYGVSSMKAVISTTPDKMIVYDKATVDGKLEVLVVTGGTSDDVYGVFTEVAINGGSNKDDYATIVNGFIGGAEFEKYADATGTAVFDAVNAELTTPSATIFKLVLDASGEIESITKVEIAGTHIDVITNVTLDDTKKSTVEGSVLTAKGAKYELESDIIVYVWDADDEEWTIGKVSALAGKKSADCTIKLFKTDDEADYDIAIVVEK